MELIERTKELPVFANKDLQKATNKIFKIGTSLRKSAYEIAFIMSEVESNKSYVDDGFKNVHEWATQTFGFKKSMSYTLLKVGKEYTREITGANNKVVGYGSNLIEESETDFTTSQIEKMLPIGHEMAERLVESGEITPDMTCTEIGKIVKVYTADEVTEITGEGEETESTGEVEETEISIMVTDENGNKYLVPESILTQYRA